MNPAKIIYISLTVLSAWTFFFVYLGNIQPGWTLLMTVLTGCAALSASWLAWHYVQPVSTGSYLGCGLLTALLFHVALAIGIFCYFFVRSIGAALNGGGFSELFAGTAASVMLLFGALVVSFLKAGIYTVWLCMQAALLTKGLLRLIDTYK